MDIPEFWGQRLEAIDASWWEEQSHLIVLVAGYGKTDQRYMCCRSSRLLVWIHLVIFPSGTGFRKRHHLLAKMPNDPTCHRKVLHRRSPDTDVEVPDSESSSTCSASGDRISHEFCRSFHEYLGWHIPWCTTFVHHCAFQPTSSDSDMIMRVWENAYHCLDLNIRGHCSLAGKGSPVKVFPSHCGLRCVLFRVHISFVQNLLTALVIFYNFMAVIRMND